MTKKDCGNHDSFYRHKLYRRLFAGILSLIIFALFIILVIWLVLRPSKPKFLLEDISIYQFNISDSNLLSTNLQLTISAQNPNNRIGIYYDRLDAFAEYAHYQITAATRLPTGYQGHNDVVIWSPFVSGIAVPITSNLADEISQGENAELLLIYIKFAGRLRWKVGSWISAHYHIQVNCPAFFTISNGKGNGESPAFHFQKKTTCSVDV